MIKLFRVVFVFDNEHRKILSVATESKEELYKRITSSHSSWFEHYDKDKKVNLFRSMKNLRYQAAENGACFREIHSSRQKSG